MSISGGANYVDFQGLSQIKSAAGKKDPEAMEKVAEQFEALFLQTMLKTMRATSFDNGLMDNDASKMYRDMADQQLALDMAKQRQGGIANMVLRELRRDAGLPEYGVVEKAKFDPSLVGIDRLRRLSSVQVDRSPQAAPIIPVFDSPQAFVKALMPLAQQSGKTLGLDPKVLIAQAALETGWGQAISGQASGQSSHNLFNIKADERWQGPTVNVSTLEYEQGLAQRQFASFRVYPDFQASFNDYVEFVTTSPRYDEARAQDDSRAYIRALQSAGYATDPVYADKVIDIMQRADVFGG